MDITDFSNFMGRRLALVDPDGSAGVTSDLSSAGPTSLGDEERAITYPSDPVMPISTYVGRRLYAHRLITGTRPIDDP